MKLRLTCGVCVCAIARWCLKRIHAVGSPSKTMYFQFVICVCWKFIIYIYGTVYSKQLYVHLFFGFLAIHDHILIKCTDT